MTEKTNVEEKIEEMLNAEEFDVFDYIDEQPIAEDEVEIAVNSKAVRELNKLIEEREIVLAERRAQIDRTGSAGDLSISDADDDTEYDDEINRIYDEIKKTALVFELQSVAPKLVTSIRSHYAATKPKEGVEEIAEHEERMNADILRRAIAAVRTQSGKRSTKEWTIEEILQLDERFYPEQANKLVTALVDIVYMGSMFDKALTSDFS